MTGAAVWHPGKYPGARDSRLRVKQEMLNVLAEF
jgi:hypothetical protein